MNLSKLISYSTLLLLLVLVGLNTSAYAQTTHFTSGNGYDVQIAGVSGVVEQSFPIVFPFSNSSKLDKSDFVIAGDAITDFTNAYIEVAFICERSGTTFCFGKGFMDHSGDVQLVISVFKASGIPGVPDGEGYKSGEEMKIEIYDHDNSKLYTVCTASSTVFGGGTVTFPSNFSTAPFLLEVNEVAAYSNATPIAPAIGAVAQPTTVDLEWTDLSAVAGDDYRVYFADTELGLASATPTDVDKATNTLEKTGLTMGQQYFWRVDTYISGAWVTGTVGNFYVILDSPVITAPVHGTNDLTTGVLSVSFNTVYGADSYTVTVTGTGVNETTNVSTSPATFSAGTLDNCESYTITASSQNTISGNHSDMALPGTVIVATAPSEITTTYPSSGEKAVAFNPTFTWTADACADSYNLVVYDASDNPIHTKTGVLTATYTLSAITLATFTNYKWSVEAVNLNGVVSESKTMIPFRTAMDCFDASSIAPSDNELQVSQTPNFSWGAITGATDYTLTVLDDGSNVVLLKNVTTNSFTWNPADADLLLDGVYTWNVRAYADNGVVEFIICGDYTFTVLMETPHPLTPTDNANCVSTASGTFTWTAKLGSTIQRIQYKEDVTNWVDPTTSTIQLPSSTPTWNYGAGDFDKDKIYEWRVEAFKDGNWTGYSEVFTFSTEYSILIPTLPVDGERGIGSSVSLTLQTPVFAGPPANYSFELSKVADFSTSSISPSVVNPVTVNSLDVATLYYWRATSDKCGTTDASMATVHSFTTVPDVIALTSPTNTAIDIPVWENFTWTADLTADGYEIAWGTDPAALSESQDVGSFTTTTLVGLQASTTYHWNVRGYQVASDMSKQYGAFNATPFSFTTEDFGPPALLTPIDGANNQMLDVELTWTPDLNAVFYGLQVSTTPDFSGTLKVDMNTETINVGNNTSIVITDLIYGETYYWRASTFIDAPGGGYLNSGNSNAYSFTVIPEATVTGDNSICNTPSYNSVNYTTDVIPSTTYTWAVDPLEGSITAGQGTPDVTIKWIANGVDRVVFVDRSGPNWLTYSSGSWVPFSDDGMLDGIEVAEPTVIVGDLDIIDYEGNTDDLYCVNEKLTLMPDYADVPGRTIVDNRWIIEDVDPANPPAIIETEYLTLNLEYQWTVPGTYRARFYASTDDVTCEVFADTIMVEVSDTCDVSVLLEGDFELCKGDGNSTAEVTSYVYGGNGEYSYEWTPSTAFLTSGTKDNTLLSTNQAVNFLLKVNDTATGYGVGGGSTSFLRKPYPTVKRTVRVPKRVANPFDLENTDSRYRVISNWDHLSASEPNTAVWEDRYHAQLNGTEVILAPGSYRYYMTMWNYDGDCSSYTHSVTVIKSRRKETGNETFTLGNNGDAYMYSYPNPCVNELTVEAEFIDPTIINVSIMDITGQIVKKFTPENAKYFEKTYNVEDLTSGSYFLLLESNDDTIVWKFIKQ